MKALVWVILGWAFMLLAAEPAFAEQRRFNLPRVNGLAVDRCSPWAENCGQGGADAFCQQQGYDRAYAWDLYRPGRTWVLGSERRCDGGECQGLRFVDCARHNQQYPGSPSGSEVFNFPRIQGIPVDRCAVWGEGCGQEGADRFCQTKGFSRAVAFQTFRTNSSYVLGSRRTCDNNCEAFSRVRCVGDRGDSNPPPVEVPSILRPTPQPSQPSGGVQRFERPRAGGAMVDACAAWAENCGRGGADLFCRQQGYGQAVNWQTMPSNRSYVIGSNRYCNESCTVLRFVDCANR
jgi:hypothetical protein